MGGGADAYAGFAAAATNEWYNACSAQGVNVYPYADTYNATKCNGENHNLSGDGVQRLVLGRSAWPLRHERQRLGMGRLVLGRHRRERRVPRPWRIFYLEAGPSEMWRRFGRRARAWSRRRRADNHAQHDRERYRIPLLPVTERCLYGNPGTPRCTWYSASDVVTKRVWWSAPPNDTFVVPPLKPWVSSPTSAPSAVSTVTLPPLLPPVVR